MTNLYLHAMMGGHGPRIVNTSSNPAVNRYDHECNVTVDCIADSATCRPRIACPTG